MFQSERGVSENYTLTAVQADDIEGLAGETEGKARVGRVGRDERIPRLLVVCVELSQLRPKQPLKGAFA